MEAAARRQAILNRLRTADRPVSASSLAAELNVSRPIIVGDIALLRAGGAEISATPRGYVLPRATDGITRTIACRHTLEQTGTELDILVDNGCTVLDVSVEHPVYGAGTVLSVKPLGGDRLLEIAFVSVGTMKVMSNYAKLKKPAEV